MQVVVRREARQELLTAQLWFEANSPGLGFDFARSVDAAIEAVLRDPRAYPEIGSKCRRILLRRFPYSVIYRLGDYELVIVAVFHQRRRPGAWQHRVTSSDM